MKRPEHIRQVLQHRFLSQHTRWLEIHDTSAWPLEISLGLPSETVAIQQLDNVRDWITTWQSWQGPGEIIWCNRRWRTLGEQRLPQKLRLDSAVQIAAWIGEANRWQVAKQRYAQLISRWPQLTSILPRHFAMLADYSAADFDCLLQVLDWFHTQSTSLIYPRQLPITGIHSKWLETRQALLADLVYALKNSHANASTTNSAPHFFQQCGLKSPPTLMRMRLLDAKLRSALGGLSDISAPIAELAALPLPLTRVFIVENLQSGLAFDDITGAVLIMGLGYGVNVLADLPWLAHMPCYYWGDLDSHGFAILHRARHHVPHLQSLLMDQTTLLQHQPLWGEEKKPHRAATLSLLSPTEQATYDFLKHHQPGQSIRLEQERIAWDYAWAIIHAIVQPIHNPCYIAESPQSKNAHLL
jgi:hypothetical protein